MVEQRIVITHRTGLHARPAAQFVQTANRFKSAINVQAGGRKASAKSILGVLSLGASHGTEIVISADGEDEQEALAALVELVRSDFGEA